MKNLILDSEPLSRLARLGDGSQTRSRVLNAVQSALNDDVDILVPAAVLAELYRGGEFNQELDACLNRYRSIEIVPTGKGLARRIGEVLARAGLGSEHHVDASLVAAAMARGGGVILTGDPTDLEALASPWPNIVVVPLTRM